MRFFKVLLLASMASLVALTASSVRAESTQLTNEGNGLHVGKSATQKLGFFGAAPVTQPTNAGQAAITAGASLKYIAFTGHSGAGACTATGLSVGDTIVGIVNITDGTTATANFEATVSVANQIQQSSATDLSAKKFAIIVDTGQGANLANQIRSALVALGLIKGS